MHTKTALITGANRGIGLEFCQKLLAQEFQVHATCRNPSQAKELLNLQSQYPLLTIHTLDVTNQNDIENLASTLKEIAIDRLILNAGISGENGVTIGNISAENFQHVYATNTIAPICILNELHQNLAKSTEKLVLVVSSKMGSISDNQSGKSYAYRSSKTALNSIMISAALDLAAQNIKILLLHPGWVKTDMTGDHAPIDAKTSVAGMLSIAQQADHWKSGTFIDYKQDLINW